MKFVLTGIGVMAVFVIIYQIIKYQTPVEVSIEEHDTFFIDGSYFEGDWQDPQLLALYKKTDELALNDGNMVATSIFYNDANEDDGFTKAFIGISSPDSVNRHFDEIRSSKSGRYLKGIIRNDYISIPQRIYVEIEDFAKENKLVIGDYSIEQYFSDTLMYVFVPIE